MALGPTTYQYKLSAEQQKNFAGIYLLRRMINGGLMLQADLPGDDSFLKPTLDWLYSKSSVAVDTKRATWAPTEQGRDHLVKFEQRYYDYLKTYDIYSAVDTGAGEFGFAYINYFSSVENCQELLQDPRWSILWLDIQPMLQPKHWADTFSSAAFKQFLRADNWEDLRVAVAEYKKLDSLEIVFMSLINEGRLDKGERAWQFDLHAGWAFAEVEKICNAAVHVDQLGSEDVIRDIITQGSQLMIALIEREEQIRAEQAATAQAEAEREAALARQTQQAPQQGTTTTTTTYTTVEPVTYMSVVEPVYYPSTYWGVYATNPFYVAPIWYDPWYW